MSLLVKAVLLALLILVPSMSIQVHASEPIPIKHIIIVVQENHTFDNYFGIYPGANGIANAEPQSGVAPFALTGVYPKDLCHSATCARDSYDNGSMDGFVRAAQTSATMGYYGSGTIPYYWDYASQYVLMDNYFTSVLGPSMPNHLYLVAGQSGGLQTNNASYRYGFKTIVDELDAANISWKWYTNGPHVENAWSPLPGSTTYNARNPNESNIVQSAQFLSDIGKPGFPSVAWVMPGTQSASEHPPENITAGEGWVVSLINGVMKSPYWNSSTIILTWDDYGGWYDHAVPPKFDAYGLGFRVPALIVSPYAKEGFVDHTTAEHSSTLRFIETVFDLPALTQRDAYTTNLLEAFDFSQQPRAPLVLPGPFIPNHYPLVLSNETTTSETATSDHSTSSSETTSSQTTRSNETATSSQNPGGRPSPSPTVDYAYSSSLILAVVGATAILLKWMQGRREI